MDTDPCCEIIILLVYSIMPVSQLSPLDLTEKQTFTLPGANNPTNIPSNHVGGYKARRTYKRFMRGRKNYKKSVKRYLTSSSGMISKLMRKIRGSSRRKR